MTRIVGTLENDLGRLYNKNVDIPLVERGREPPKGGFAFEGRKIRTNVYVDRMMLRSRFPVYGLLLAAVVVLIVIPPCFGQDLGDIVSDLTLTSVSATTSRLTWEDESVECLARATYNVFRGTSKDFTPSSANRIASGLTKTTYLAKEPVEGRDYYYYVTASLTPTPCIPHTGTVLLYPVDLGQRFTIEIGDDAGICTAESTSEIRCVSPLPDFHAVVAQQGAHEYLIGCRTADYEGGDWTCVNLTSGAYRVEVHSRTIIVWGSGMYKADIKTGRKIESIIPKFSVLTRIH
jgi:hypothetical protein